jgi:hypothetical protein
LKSGIIPYVLEILFKNDLNETSRHNLNVAVKRSLPHLKQGGSNGFPRLYFPNGITNLSNLTAEEHVGILFMVYLLMFTNQGKMALQKTPTMTANRIKLYEKVFEKLLIFVSWMSRDTGFWKANDPTAMAAASGSIKALMGFIVENFSRSSAQGWNISKMHELLHVCKFIELYGAPANYDSSASERLHKDVAKKPGRRSQKRHETFNHQCAVRLADRHILDFAYKMLNDDPTCPKASGEKKAAEGSHFTLLVQETPDTLHYEVSVVGTRSLSSEDLANKLYPNLVEYIVSYMSEAGDVHNKVRCCSEWIDEHGVLYRGHHNYRGNGFWHDWAWVSYTNDSEEGFANVPAKILCFLPHGFDNMSETLVVCHPSNFRHRSLSLLVTEWQLVAPTSTMYNAIPYDVVPASSLCGHCLIVPDLFQESKIYEIAEKDSWENYF